MAIHWPLTASVVAAVALATTAGAQAPSGGFGEAQLLSLYVRRHANTAAFADLAVTRGADGQVRKTAETLARAHREAREKLEKAAAEHHLTLAPPERDTSTALLAAATAALQGKTGRAFDSTWASLADAWLSTLILDNNRNVKPQAAAAGLSQTANEHTTWLFHQSIDVVKLKKKFT